jgi:hypothetical protein
MAGAKLFGLYHVLALIAKRSPHRLVAVPDNQRRRSAGKLAARFDGVLRQGLPAKVMQNFRQSRFHAGSLPGGKNHNRKCHCHHSKSGRLSRKQKMRGT